MLQVSGFSTRFDNERKILKTDIEELNIATSVLRFRMVKSRLLGILFMLGPLVFCSYSNAESTGRDTAVPLTEK